MVSDCQIFNKRCKTWKLYHSNSIAVHFCTNRYLIIWKDISHISHNTVILLWMHHCMKSLRGSMRFVDLEYKNFFQKIFIAKLQTFTAYVKYNPSFPYILAFYAFDFFFVIRANEILWWYYIDICSLKFTYLHKWYKV